MENSLPEIRNITDEDVKNIVVNIEKYKKIRELFMKSLKEKEEIEVSAVELAEAVGKEAKIVNRDIREEFNYLFTYGEAIEYDDDPDLTLMKSGIRELEDSVRIETQKDSQGKDRPVYMLKGIAIGQIVTRWDKPTRLMILILLRMLTRNIEEMSHTPSSMSEIADYMSMAFGMALKMKLEYIKLRDSTNSEHIKENQQWVIDTIKQYEYEIAAVQKTRKKVMPALKRIANELKKLDQDNANVLEKQEENALFGEELAETLRKSR